MIGRSGLDPTDNVGQAGRRRGPLSQGEPEARDGGRKLKSGTGFFERFERGRGGYAQFLGGGEALRGGLRMGHAQSQLGWLVIGVGAAAGKGRPRGIGGVRRNFEQCGQGLARSELAGEGAGPAMRFRWEQVLIVPNEPAGG
ncbi:MAG: hypothetical protein RL077_6233, partial [Verrucomicrobiota bacterium]